MTTVGFFRNFFFQSCDIFRVVQVPVPVSPVIPCLPGSPGGPIIPCVPSLPLVPLGPRLPRGPWTPFGPGGPGIQTLSAARQNDSTTIEVTYRLMTSRNSCMPFESL